MQESALKKLFAISVKARALRAWQERSEGGPKGLSEREVLVLELVEEFTQYAISFRPVRQVVWSITGAAGVTSEGEVERVTALARSTLSSKVATKALSCSGSRRST